jgi:hypothetical protein
MNLTGMVYKGCPSIGMITITGPDPKDTDRWLLQSEKGYTWSAVGSILVKHLGLKDASVDPTPSDNVLGVLDPKSMKFL